MFASILFAVPSSVMAQQQTITTTTAQPTIIAPLTPEEQQQQDRLQNTIAAISRNLVQGEKKVYGIVYNKDGQHLSGWNLTLYLLSLYTVCLESLQNLYK